MQQQILAAGFQKVYLKKRQLATVTVSWACRQYWGGLVRLRVEEHVHQSVAAVADITHSLYEQVLSL